MGRMIECFNLDTGSKVYFVKNTPYEAMEALIYWLNLRAKDSNAKIQLCGGGRTLSVTHRGETWSCLNS